MVLSLGLALGAAPAFPAEEDAPFNRTPRDCLFLSDVRRTEILDDQTIIFYAWGGKVAYRNYLPRACPGLVRAGHFGYTVRSWRLCNTDAITVFQRMFDDLQPGVTCRLGNFYPLSSADIDSLKSENKRRPAVREEAVGSKSKPKADPGEPPSPTERGSVAPQP